MFHILYATFITYTLITSCHTQYTTRAGSSRVKAIDFMFTAHPGIQITINKHHHHQLASTRWFIHLFYCSNMRAKKKINKHEKKIRVSLQSEYMFYTPQPYDHISNVLLISILVFVRAKKTTLHKHTRH